MLKSLLISLGDFNFLVQSHKKIQLKIKLKVCKNQTELKILQ